MVNRMDLVIEIVSLKCDRLKGAKLGSVGVKLCIIDLISKEVGQMLNQINPSQRMNPYNPYLP